MFILHQIPAILNHHEILLEQLRNRLETWEPQQTIGDVFLEVVSAYCPIKNSKNYYIAINYLNFSVYKANSFGNLCTFFGQLEVRNESHKNDECCQARFQKFFRRKFFYCKTNLCFIY